MTQPGVEMWQLAVVAAFLAALLALRWVLTRNAPRLRAQLRRGQRVVHVESQSLGAHTLVSLVEVDRARVLVVHGRGAGQAVLALDAPAKGNAPPIATGAEPAGKAPDAPL